MMSIFPRAPLALSVIVTSVSVVLGCHGHDHAHEGESSHGPHGAHEREAVPHEHQDHDDHGERDEHGHGHGEGAIGITVWTERLELFAEHPPAINGQELTFLAHLTILEGFTPLEEATVTLVLEGPTRVEARVTEMLRSGIFQPSLIAPEAGTYRGSLVVVGPEVEDTLDGFEIVVHPTEESAQAAADDDAGATAGGPEPIAFLKEQQWQVPFATAFATMGAVIPTVEVPGEVSTPPGGRAEIGAAIAGRVIAPRDGLPRPGQAVRRGEVLATIAPTPASPEAAANASLAIVETEARLQAARDGVDRAERLIADRAISDRELEDARRELRVAEGAVLAARRAQSVFAGAASGRGSGLYRVRAPIDGIVVSVEATPGRSAQIGDHLFQVVDLEELWIVARVPEQQATRIRADQDAAYALPGVDAWLALDVTGADPAVISVNVARTVDRLSRTVDVTYTLNAADERLRVGAMLRVAVPVGEPWEGVVVPRDAVLDDDGRAIVYVQEEGESFVERTVRLGPRSGAQVGIVSGVRAGERVVTRGANVVRLASRASDAPSHGHVH